MEQYVIMIARTLFLYFLILLIFRIMGKREIGELSILDLVVFIMIGEMAVIAIEKTEDPLLHTVVPMLVLMIIQILFALLSLKSETFRELVDGKPTIIINKGKIDEEAMRKQRYNFDDLLVQLREKNVKNVADVEFAILEPSGKLSVFEKEKGKKKQPSLALPLIKDGVIQEEHLALIDQTNLWLRQQLRKRGYKDIKKISYCTYEDGIFYIDEKD
ncbi:uncharacterized membrane protein YcaP (DUF421 family) [Thermolongibacillus altinsuensis]|uniref:Uncharacterized membrane protein YcaP (DUF421 family) n=2 Tax=Thermolongibacillus altinsuensis TaxID=575256 RepID=A0A4V2QAH3_9BACL|nr:uncharacterized membrane protein YcaP (DUF421 family) [Thermolongibacillus altinsuensis]GMB07500.1 DUF421 domain-containing protein [Thermolongibacillus altinsuensis]